MRVGFNPNKDKELKSLDYFHQVIIPVYIPNHQGYFKDSFTILKYCLESLFKTSHKKTYFTIVNNGSSEKVVSYLNELYETDKIHEVIHTTNIGKLNAIFKGLVGQKFQLITITDADVLFLNNWQKETYKVFEIFKKAGSVSTTANPKLIRYHTSNILFEKGLSKDLRFSKVLNANGMKFFAKSIGHPELYNKYNLEKQLTISKGKVKAAIGAGHFVATYRGDIFNKLKFLESSFSLGGESERKLLDEPVVNRGYWRLATENNYTYHMGNTIESWMPETLVNIRDKKNNLSQPKLVKLKELRVLNFIKNVIFDKIIHKKIFWQFFLRYKGLSKNESEHF